MVMAPAANITLPSGVPRVIRPTGYCSPKVSDALSAQVYPKVVMESPSSVCPNKNVGCVSVVAPASASSSATGKMTGSRSPRKTREKKGPVIG